MTNPSEHTAADRAKRAADAVRKLYDRGWSRDAIQHRLYDCVLAARTDEASARLVAMDEITRG